MITKALLAKAVVVSAAVLLLCVLSWTGSIYAADKPFVLGQYPALKFGFTSQNLAKWLPNSVDNLKKVIDFASRKGFSFIELRDANVGLSYDDAKKIAAYARKKKIEVIYAMGIGGLDAYDDIGRSRPACGRCRPSGVIRDARRPGRAGAFEVLQSRVGQGEYEKESYLPFRCIMIQLRSSSAFGHRDTTNCRNGGQATRE